MILCGINKKIIFVLFTAIYIKDNGKLVLIRKKLQTNCINIGGILSEYGTD